MISCQKCGAQNNEESVFCYSCGEKLNKGIVCLNCGLVQLPKEAQFCPRCGEKLEYRHPIEIKNFVFKDLWITFDDEEGSIGLSPTNPLFGDVHFFENGMLVRYSKSKLLNQNILSSEPWDDMAIPFKDILSLGLLKTMSLGYFIVMKVNYDGDILNWIFRGGHYLDRSANKQRLEDFICLLELYRRLWWNKYYENVEEYEKISIYDDEVFFVNKRTTNELISVYNKLPLINKK